MEIRVVIKKSHVFLILAFILVVGFAVAQLSAPNPGHTYDQVAGAARNCIGNANSLCTGPSSQGWGLGDVAVASGQSWNTNNFGGLGLGSFCRSDGSNCAVSNAPVAGSIVAGGNDGGWDGQDCAFQCFAWGGATCSTGLCGGFLACPSGSTPRVSGDSPGVAGSFYVCVKN